MKTLLQKIFLISVLALCTLPVSAQLRLGFRAGLNAVNQNLPQAPNRFGNLLGGLRLENQSLKLSFHAGVIGDYEINRVMSFQSGLIYSDKGTRFFFKEKIDDIKIVISETVNIGYLEVPLMFVYRYETSRTEALRLGFGGYVSVALFGTYRLRGRGDGVTESESIDINFGNTQADNYKGSDVGIALEVSYDFNGFIVGTGLNYGITNVTNTGNTVRNFALQAQASYLFNAGGRRGRRRR